MGHTSSGVTLGWDPAPRTSGVRRDGLLLPVINNGLQFTRPRFFRKGAGETIQDATLRYNQEHIHCDDDYWNTIFWAFQRVTLAPAGAWLLYLPYGHIFLAAAVVWLLALFMPTRRRSKTATSTPTL